MHARAYESSRHALILEPKSGPTKVGPAGPLATALKCSNYSGLVHIAGVNAVYTPVMCILQVSMQRLLLLFVCILQV